MKNLQAYVFENNKVKIIEINSEPMFEVYSTGMALGQVKYNSIGAAYARKDRINENIKNAEIIPCVHGGHKYISESQLYDLMLEMKTDKVKPFRKWITTDVLPTIRKTGGYVNNTSQFTDFYFADCDNPTKQFISTLLDEKVKLTGKVNELLPKAETYDMVMDADGTFSLNQVAKFVGIGEYKLFQFLREQKILFYEGEDSIPYERFRKNKCFKVVMTRDPRGQGHSTTKVYPKGVDYICKVIAKSERTVA